ncbi:hypothetical protein [Cellulomonas hominis]|uniref:hypothetical protein n=1 Tax=Cellulomonas hominis TaxID=156981 RepID=UPI001B98AE34|nr:hypothetical protein [Cellulomonas hominis]VTR76313.1 hypothetical protein CHMI_01070 [Cellulomonas hominis]
MSTHITTTQPVDDRNRRRKAFVAWGALAGVAALATAAAFTDIARLNIGANGIGGAESSYNIQVGATDAAGEFVPGWQEADAPAGVPIALSGADAVFPGSDPVSVTIPVRNDSATFDSSLRLSLEQLADDAGNGRVTDADYLASLRFDVAMPATALDAAPVLTQDLTFAEVAALELNTLGADEESTVTLSVRLLTQEQSEASYDDNSLSGKGAFLQARLDGSSV